MKTSSSGSGSFGVGDGFRRWLRRLPFERTLSVNGRVELSVATGSGNIHLTRGAGNQVHIFGK